MKTNGGNGGYSRKKAVPKGNPRTPKNASKPGGNVIMKRSQDGTRANSRRK